ncbi:uncharacterized protein LOC135822474 [Sycon ciliatum]|uniref:uncharacterized protein LOC135822474 n=1 Tax=Sycon ciliatum TaxID=27933 RepID=UPI0031F6155E
MESHHRGEGIVFNVSLQGTIMCLKDSDCGSLEFCCPDGQNGSMCCERSASVRALWIMGVFLCIAIMLCLAILVRSRTRYLRCGRSHDDHGPHQQQATASTWSPVLTTLRELPPPYSTKPLSSRELLSLQRQAMRYRAQAQQSLAPVTESMLAEFEQLNTDTEQQSQQQHMLPCYHDVTQPIMEEPSVEMMRRVSPIPNLDEDELVYQSDSTSDDSEVEQGRLKYASYASAAARNCKLRMTPLPPPPPMTGGSKSMSRSYDAGIHNVPHKLGSASSGAMAAAASSAKPCSGGETIERPRPFSRSTSVSPDIRHMYTLAAPGETHLTLLPPPPQHRLGCPPRRNRSWSSSAAPSPLQYFLLDDSPNPLVMPSRPYTSMDLRPLPGYTAEPPPASAMRPHSSLGHTSVRTPLNFSLQRAHHSFDNIGAATDPASLT